MEQARASIRQAEVQGEEERRQWRRMLRRDAAVAFILAAHEYVDALDRLVDASYSSGSRLVAQAHLDQVESAHQAMRRASVIFDLEAPSSGDASTRIMVRAFLISNQMPPPGTGGSWATGFSQQVSELRQMAGALNTQLRAHLDD
ncbi:hypothetical protein ACFY0G_34455 [Streptomyces sp. NPDC001552]|uniref:hypothetical protein n=1 Tax=Streptomyces sp. NPDC001552 TaxID=3364587 RepID=UPI0036BBEF6B